MTTTEFQIAFYYYRLLHPTVLVTARQPLAQAVLESGNFTSHNWQVNNNCMGMTAPQARNTTALNKGGKGYASYASPLDGISDLFYWYEALGLLDDNALDAFIKAGKYATDKNYYTKVEAGVSALQSAGSYMNPTAIYAGAAAGALVLAGGTVALGYHFATS